MRSRRRRLEGIDMYDRAIGPAKLAVAKAIAERKSVRKSSRTGAVQIAGHFPEEVRMQLKVIAAEQRRDVQDLLAEGLNMIFAKYGRREIARVKRIG